MVDNQDDTSRRLVYHYTTRQGLQGILEEKTIRATNILYLNDSSEFINSLDVAKSVIDEQFARLGEFVLTGKTTSNFNYDPMVLDSIRKTLESLDNYLSKPRKLVQIFVCCFSYNLTDDLSQWRGYSPNGNGYCIGFSKKQLDKQAEKYGFEYQECTYKRDEQKQSLSVILDQMNALDRRSGQDFLPSPKAQIEFFLNELIRIAPRLKHPSFYREGEVRYVLIEPDPSKLKVKYRAGNSMMIPYIELPLVEDGAQLQIPELIIGPTQERYLSKLSIEGLLESKKVHCDSVRVSNIPYRSL